MKLFIGLLLIVQCGLFSIGVWQVAKGKICVGVFNVVVNLIYGAIHIHNIKSLCYENDLLNRQSKE